MAGRFVTDHCVTGIACRQPVKPPTGTAVATASRTSSPPWRRWASASSASDSSVTVLATSRPPAGSASQQAASRPGAVRPPPTKTASGVGRPARASGAGPVTTFRAGTPSASALRAMRAARSGSFSIATARQARWVRIHSMPREPEPPPTSQRSSPGAGASAARVAARTYRLVSCPSCSYASSGRPGAAPSRSASGSRTQSSARTWSASVRSYGQASAVASRTRSRGPPSCSRTRMRVPPQPVSHSRDATRAGVSGPSPRTRTRRPGCSTTARAASGRATRDTVSVSSRGQPSRAQAYETEDGCGWIRSRSAPTVSARVRPMPWKEGSPLARTAIARPAWAASRPGTAGRRGEGQAIRSPGQSPPGSRSSWRGAPIRTSAARRTRREASGSPPQPSAPIPTTAIPPDGAAGSAPGSAADVAPADAPDAAPADASGIAPVAPFTPVPSTPPNSTGAPGSPSSWPCSLPGVPPHGEEDPDEAGEGVRGGDPHEDAGHHAALSPAPGGGPGSGCGTGGPGIGHALRRTGPGGRPRGPE